MVLHMILLPFHFAEDDDATDEDFHLTISWSSDCYCIPKNDSEPHLL
jgi:hypothetical protein